MINSELKQTIIELAAYMGGVISEDPDVLDLFEHNQITETEIKNNIILWFALATIGAYASGSAEEDADSKAILEYCSNSTIDIEEELSESFDGVVPVLESFFKDHARSWQITLHKKLEE